LSTLKQNPSFLSHLLGGLDKCWGFNDDGELGLGDILERSYSSGQMGDALPFVNLGTGLEALVLAAGHQHTCAVLTSGLVKCWGRNYKGESG
jgi:E3 ubiquitin-protein ligase HERC3